MASPLLKSEDNYDLIKAIGSGAFGLVTKIKTKQDGKFYALKHIDLKKFPSQEEKDDAIKEAKAEYGILKKHFQNVVKAYGSFHDKDNDVFMFSMDYYPNNLASFMAQKSRKGNELSMSQVSIIFRDIVHGVKNLFEKGKTVHRDLKPENVLMATDERAFVGDVGAAKQFSNISFTRALKSVNTLVGTPIWMAPEIQNAMKEAKQDKAYDSYDQSKTDIFSLGLICLYMLDYNHFNLKENEGLNKDSIKLEKYLNETRKRILYPANFFYLLRGMLSFDPKIRPGIEEISQELLKMSEDNLANETITQLKKEVSNLQYSLSVIAKNLTISEEKKNCLKEENYDLKCKNNLNNFNLNMLAFNNEI